MKLRKRYIIEYIDNEKDFETFSAGNHPNPWELFKTEIIEEKNCHEVYDGREGIDGKAWCRFFLWSLCPDRVYIDGKDRITHPIYCQMWVEMVDEDGKIVYEDLCELPSTVKHTFFSAINDEARRELDQARKTVKECQEKLENFHLFLQKYHAEEQYRKFIEEIHND